MTKKLKDQATFDIKGGPVTAVAPVAEPETSARALPLAKLDRAHAMLAKANTLGEVKKIRDMAEGARAAFKAAHLGRERQNEAAEIALLAARKAGAILKQLQKTRPQSAAKVAGDSEYRKALRHTRTPERTARHWQRIAEVTEFIAQQYFAEVRKAEKGEITTAGLLREADKYERLVASFTDDPADKKALLEQGRIEGAHNWQLVKNVGDIVELERQSWSDDGQHRIGLSLKAVEDAVEMKVLYERFGAPPFSTLDLRKSYWSDRKRAWETLGIRGEEGRGDEHKAVYDDRMGNFDTSISVFNPAVTETIYEWFAPVGGHILDPFAGGSTRGIVAAKSGYKYTGIELRSEQIEENHRQVQNIETAAAQHYTDAWGRGGPPTWIEGDSADLSSHVAGQQFDMICTCPPYYNLERYTKADERDLSRCKTYEEFMAKYEDIFHQAIKHMKENRFAVVVVSEIRDKTGWYRNFVGDTVSCFQRLGLHYYNEIILLDPIGSAARRVGKPFSCYRKVQKAHQNVLVFWKGNDVKRIPKALGVLEEVGHFQTAKAR